MASWYANDHYGKTVSAISRGSGIDPKDDFHPEPHAVELLLEDKYASKGNLKYQHATPATIQDINSANIVITMTNSHRNRLLKLIDRECLPSNLDTRSLSASSRAQWDDMCNNKDALKNKIFTLIKCATGADGDVADAFGQDKPFYEKVLKTITSNIDQAVANYKATSQWCVIPATGPAPINNEEEEASSEVSSHGGKGGHSGHKGHNLQTRE